MIGSQMHEVGAESGSSPSFAQRVWRALFTQEVIKEIERPPSPWEERLKTVFLAFAITDRLRETVKETYYASFSSKTPDELTEKQVNAFNAGVLAADSFTEQARTFCQFETYRNAGAYYAGLAAKQKEDSKLIDNVIKSKNSKCSLG